MVGAGGNAPLVGFRTSLTTAGLQSAIRNGILILKRTNTFAGFSHGQPQGFTADVSVFHRHTSQGKPSRLL